MSTYRTRKKERAKDVVIIGGRGMIASHVLNRLALENLRVRVLSRHPPEYLPSNADYIEGEIANSDIVKKCVAGARTLLHLANPVGRNWDDYVQNVIDPTVSVAKTAAESGVHHFIYTSSIDLYNSADRGMKITGDTPADPAIIRRNHYARAKAACEARLREIAETTDMTVTILRLGLTIGKGGSPAHRGVAHFGSLTRAYLWGSGTNKLPFVLADDVAEAIALTMKNSNAARRTLLICAPPEITARDYMQAVAAQAQVAVSVRPCPVSIFWGLEALKESVKHLLRHPNRRAASLHDWQCRAHLAEYDPSRTMEILGWRPSHDKESLISRGIIPAVDEFINQASPCVT